MVKIEYIGHACFLIESSFGKILIDPYIVNNPLAENKYSLEDFDDVDLILVTHGHGDHLGDTVELATKNDIAVIAIYELATWLASQGVKVIPLNFGGSFKANDLEITMVPAVHSGNVVEDIIYPTGPAAGFIIKTDDKTLYHTGDTMVFSDMGLFRELYGPIDVVMLPIDGVYNMDIKQAKYAIQLLKPRYVVPMHYNTWSHIRADPTKLKTDISELVILQPGDSFEF